MRRAIVALSVATGLTLAGSSSGLASLLTVVSGPSPVANCTAGNETGTNFPNSEVEPYIAVNPVDPRNLIGAWQQDRWSDGGAHALVAGSSSDSGKTWSETLLPLSECVPGGLPYERTSDPWVSFGPDGTAYAVSISFDDTTLQSNRDAVGVTAAG
jgi:hypothetical protein